ncbi:MAG: amidohydrolase family protein [Myxococcota bacterium]
MNHLVIDADSHKCENPVVFLDYVEKPHRDRISFVRDRYGEQRIRILDRDPSDGELRERLFLQPDGWGKGTYRPYHEESTIGGLFNRVRLEHMDREGIDHQVVYGSVALAFNSVVDPELAVGLCRAYNDYIAEDCAPHRDRLHPVCALPLQDPTEAVAEMRRGVEDLGLVAAMLPPNLPRPHPAAPQAFPEVRVPRHLSDPVFDPLYAEAERLDVTLGIHGAPGFQLAGGASDQLDTFTLVHVFANRDMQQMALAKLIFDGVMERFPGLRFGFLEAGCGWLPDFIHNLYEHWEKRIVQFDPTLEPSRTQFLMELARERRGGDLALVRKAHGLLQMLFTPSEEAAPPDELERFRWEHRELRRDPREYVERGQVFLTSEPDDPAPGYLPAALGEAGTRVACFAVDYGHWDATLKDCVGLVADNPGFDEATRRAVLSDNALRLYGPRLEERIRC